MKRQCKLLTLFILIPFFGHALGNDFTHSKQKNIKKAYYVNADATVNIDNSYGNISVSTWNEDKIELDIIIKVSGDNENWVNQRIESISIDIVPLKGIITAKTVLGNSNYNNQGKNNSVEINYTIKIPQNGSVKLTNKYGSIAVTDLLADADVKCKYGKVTMGKVAGNSLFNLEYCSNSTIMLLKNGSVTAKYSGIKIENAGKLDLYSDYTDIDIDDCDALKYNSKYGKIKIQNVKSLDATGNYLTIKIGEVSNSLKLNTKYSSLNIQNIIAKTNSIAILAGYTGINIGYNSNFAFDFSILLKYANFKFDSDLELDSKEENFNSKKYTGFYKKRGQNNVNITSDYGNVTLSKNQ